ncbi:MAG TPA: hypothetical protein VN679_15145 [Candidatus Acidoferrales bacterium]|jgi:hypothetical protein|nr:hypothetical protein [Candidatus Acidoferrales bacterium]
MTQINADTVTAAYIKLRDQRSELKKAYDQEDQVLKDKMDRLETWLMETMQATNATQLGTAHGTAYIQTQYKASCSDWPTFWGFVADNGRFDMLEKRVSSKTVNEYIEETGDAPPGVNVAAELKVVVRRT